MTNGSSLSRSDAETDYNSAVGGNRRGFLAALGVGSVAATAGCLGSLNSENSIRNGDNSDGEIDPRFGYTTTGDDESPPVEADHTVDLLLSPREEVSVPEFYFEPTGLSIDTGDTVKFNMATPHHNVNAYHPAFGYNQRIPDETPAFSSPILGAQDAWFYTFENEGVHDIVCAPHEIYGMAGRIVVGSASGPGTNPIGEAPGGDQSRPPELTAGLVLGDDALAPETIVEEDTVPWEEIADENKQVLIQFPED